MLLKLTVTVDPAGTVIEPLSNFMFWAVSATDAVPPAVVVAAEVCTVVTTMGVVVVAGMTAVVAAVGVGVSWLPPPRPKASSSSVAWFPSAAAARRPDDRVTGNCRPAVDGRGGLVRPELRTVRAVESTIVPSKVAVKTRSLTTIAEPMSIESNLC